MNEMNENEIIGTKKTGRGNKREGYVGIYVRENSIQLPVNF